MTTVTQWLRIAGLIILSALGVNGIFYLISFMPGQLFKILVGLAMGIMLLFVFVVEFIEIVFPIEDWI